MEQVIKKRLQQVMDASVAKGETPGCLLMVIKDGEEQVYLDRKSTRLNSSHKHRSRMPSSA